MSVFVAESGHYPHRLMPPKKSCRMRDRDDATRMAVKTLQISGAGRHFSGFGFIVICY
jgi:hypothetical protein